MSIRSLVLATLLAATPLLGGCSWIQSSLGWDRAKPDDRKTASDLDACKDAARAINQREARITQDIGGGSFADTTTSNYSDPTLTRNMNAYAADQRYTRIVDDCMSQQGYGKPAPPGKAPGTGTAPPPPAPSP